MSPALAGGFFTTSTTWEAQEKKYTTVIKGKGMCLEVRESLDWSLNELTFLGKLFEMGIRRVPTSFFCYSYHRNNWEEPLHMILSTQWAFSKCSLHLPLPLFPIMFFLQGNESDSFFEDFMIQYFLDLLNHSHIFDYRILFIIQTLLSLEIRALGCYLCFWQPEITCRGLVGKRKIRSNLLLTTSWVRFWQSPSQTARGGSMFPLGSGPWHRNMFTQLHGHAQQPTSQGHHHWIPWAPLQLGESSSFLLTTPPPTPRMWAHQGSAIHSPHQTQYWTCHSWGSTGTHGWRTVRASAVCPHLSLKLPSDICNCLLDNVNTCTICFATSMDKRAHINWEPKKKTEKKPHFAP